MTIPAKIMPKIILMIPLHSSCMTLFNPSPIKVRPKRLGKIKIMYINCGSVVLIFYNVIISSLAYLEITYLDALVLPVFLIIPLSKRSLMSLKIVSSEIMGKTFFRSGMPAEP